MRPDARPRERAASEARRAPSRAGRRRRRTCHGRATAGGPRRGGREYRRTAPPQARCWSSSGAPRRSQVGAAVLTYALTSVNDAELGPSGLEPLDEPCHRRLRPLLGRVEPAHLVLHDDERETLHRGGDQRGRELGGVDAVLAEDRPSASICICRDVAGQLRRPRPGVRRGGWRPPSAPPATRCLAGSEARRHHSRSGAAEARAACMRSTFRSARRRNTATNRSSSVPKW